ncbi:unnamed protein product [Eruca vesicaria subsp. sativa]|uniref:Cation efflux protein cytoplasmic domain-containing protein n=1 Tax=Eruca vesicaria subsp. sativa TaxID=29727 RepID=A0ABC8JCB9_ERUVS|nr:unnamed protein product [Eruca vesicaria subsp. sativa]
MATEHITNKADEYSVELLPSDDDAPPPPLSSSWRLSLETFRLPSSLSSTGRHDTRTRFSRCFRTPKKERKISEYYKKQERLLEGFNEMETIHGTGFASGAPTEEEMKKLAKSERLAVHISNATNLVLFVAKVYASMESRSMAVIASTLDSLLDLLSGFILWFTANAMSKPNHFHYPIGKRRMQPVNGIHMNSTEEKWMIGIMVSVTIIKFLLMLYCRGFQNEIVRAYAQDHFFDVVTNSIGLATAVLAVKFYWWIDPSGAILIALYTIGTWARTVLENVHSLIGRSAPPEFLTKLTFLIWNHHEQIKHIDTVRAYTFGSHYFVEVDIVLPEDMRLQEAHNIGETLQEKLEQLAEVERAFVHIDFEFTHRPEHKCN